VAVIPQELPSTKDWPAVAKNAAGIGDRNNTIAVGQKYHGGIIKIAPIRKDRNE
jgi:hypothetical protein